MALGLSRGIAHDLRRPADHAVNFTAIGHFSAIFIGLLFYPL